MGKRKLHNQVYFQCDWTGLLMKASNCYMPTWNGIPGGKGDKMTKRGSYCNWESVVAHANYLFYVDKSIEENEFDRIVEHVYELVGPIGDVGGMHFSFLAHFKDDESKWHLVGEGPLNYSAEAYHKLCCAATEDVAALKVTPGGEMFEVLMHPNDDGQFEFDKYLTRPYMLHGDLHQPSHFNSTRKGKMHKERLLKIFYWPGKNGQPYNMIASNMFKMQIYGDILLVLATQEASFMPRERYVNFTKQQYEEVFGRKRKKPVESALTADQYREVKSEMKASLTAVEQAASASAEVPGQDRGAGMPAASGKELCLVAEMRGCQRPSEQKMMKLERRLVEPPSGASPVEAH